VTGFLFHATTLDCGYRALLSASGADIFPGLLYHASPAQEVRVPPLPEPWPSAINPNPSLISENLLTIAFSQQRLCRRPVWIPHSSAGPTHTYTTIFILTRAPRLVQWTYIFGGRRPNDGRSRRICLIPGKPHALWPPFSSDTLIFPRFPSFLFGPRQPHHLPLASNFSRSRPPPTLPSCNLRPRELESGRLSTPAPSNTKPNFATSARIEGLGM